MNLKQCVYSVLVVSATENFNNAVCDLLPKSKYSPVRISASISSAKKALAEREYDFIIVNSPLPDDIGIRFSVDACSSKNTVVLLLVRSELCDEISERVTEHGVFVLSKPTSKSTLATVLSWMASARERLRKSESKMLSIEERMEEIRTVNRAKWILISELKMDESEAHRYIEKQAMDCCVSKQVIAKQIIKTYS